MTRNDVKTVVSRANGLKSEPKPRAMSRSWQGCAKRRPIRRRV